MDKKEVWELVLRYGLLLVLGVPNLFLFYFIFTPLTTYPVFAILKLIDPSAALISLTNPSISFNGIIATLVPACIAGAAYYFLMVLNLSTPMPIKKRIWSLVFLFGSFLVLNIIRIVIFANLYANDVPGTSFTHTATWYFGSTLLLLVIWFSNVHLFRIKHIPLYSDIRSIILDIKRQRV